MLSYRSSQFSLNAKQRKEEIVMKKNILCLIIGMMMVSTIPVVSGTTPQSDQCQADAITVTSQEPEPTQHVFGWTWLCGIIFNPTESESGVITARAIIVNYNIYPLRDRIMGQIGGFKKISFAIFKPYLWIF